MEFDELPGETVEANTGEQAAADDESDEDLLEETPDFLKDAPDGEDLWFEAGKPKDFDFDDYALGGISSSSAHGPQAASPPASLTAPRPRQSGQLK